jgi:hypothetical protein
MSSDLRRYATSRVGRGCGVASGLSNGSWVSGSWLRGLSWRLAGWRVRIGAMPLSLAALRHKQDVTDSKPAGCVLPSCKPGPLIGLSALEDDWIWFRLHAKVRKCTASCPAAFRLSASSGDRLLSMRNFTLCAATAVPARGQPRRHREAIRGCRRRSSPDAQRGSRRSSSARTE